MSQTLEVLGRGLLSSLKAGFQAVLRDNEPDSTVEELRERSRTSPGDPEPWISLGQRFLRQLRTVQARECFEHAVNLDDELAHARLGLACALDELGRTDKAMEQLNEVRHQHPDDPAVCFCLGYCHERSGYLGRAVRHYHKSLDLCPSLRNARERLAAIWLAYGKPEKCIEQYERLCELDPERIEVHLMLGGLLVHAGLFEEAVDRYQLSLLMDPDSWHGRNDLAASYEQAGLLDEAIGQLQADLTRDSNNADTYLRLGDLLSKLGNEPAALEHYLRAVQVNPDYLEATIKLGAVHLRANRCLGAARWFNRAVQINDRLLSAYVGLAVAQRAAGSPKDAESSLELAMGLAPNSTLLFSEMAALQLKGSEEPTGRRNADRDVLDLQKPGGEATRELQERQIELHQNALRRNPNHADLHYRLGMLLCHKGRMARAIECYRQAVAINPAYLQARAKLGLALLQHGQKQEGNEVLDQLSHVSSEDVELHYRLGLLFCQRAQFELTVEQLQQKFENSGSNVEVHANLTLALQNMGLIDDAAAAWQGVCDLCAHQAVEPAA
jgi:superkiller protein 3